MNDKTKIYYNLARAYSYVVDIGAICNKYDNNYEMIISDVVSKHAINMCLVQIGEHAARIRDIDINLYKDKQLGLFQIKGLRDRITHSYGNVDYSIIKSILQEDIPKLKEYLENSIVEDVLNNPYVLYDEEYDVIIQQNHINTR